MLYSKEDFGPQIKRRKLYDVDAAEREEIVRKFNEEHLTASEIAIKHNVSHRVVEGLMSDFLRGSPKTN